MRKSFIFFGLIFLATLVAGNNTTESKNTKDLLSAINIFSYPNQNELNDCIYPDSAIEVTPLSTTGVNDNFTNFRDLQWLKPIAKKNKVLLFGEWHYERRIYNLCSRIFFALNTFDYYPLIVTEYPYSYTPFVDYFVRIKQDKRAYDYYKNIIYNFSPSVEDSIFFEDVRKWNKNHPKKRLHIGFHDIEHDYKTTLKLIIVPYFQKIDSSFNLDVDTLTILNLEDLTNKLEVKLEIAKQKNLIGKFPFITTQYIKCVLENLHSTFFAYRYGAAFNYYRQHAMIRNLTDERFLGKYLKNSKVMFHSGGYHTTNHFFYPEEANFYREGCYLNFDYDPTRGKTYSVLCRGYALSFGKMVNANVDSLLFNKYTFYGKMLKSFQKAYEQGLTSPDRYYLMNWSELNNFDKLVFNLAYKNKHSPMRVRKVHWDLIFTNAHKKSKEEYTDMIGKKDFYSRYDEVILIPRSAIIRAKKRKSTEP